MVSSEIETMYPPQNGVFFLRGSKPDHNRDFFYSLIFKELNHHFRNYEYYVR